GFRPLVEYVMAENENRPNPTLLSHSDGFEVGPVDLPPQYSGHGASVASHSSASPRSSSGSSLASSASKEVRRPRSWRSRSRPAWIALLRLGNSPRATQPSTSRSTCSSIVTATLVAVMCAAPQYDDSSYHPAYRRGLPAQPSSLKNARTSAPGASSGQRARSKRPRRSAST